MDQRTAFERLLWDKIGPPLYYCKECMLRVKVEVKEGEEPKIIRDKRCTHTGEIIAPRKAIMVGKGGANLATKAKISLSQNLSSLTGRSV